MLSSTLVAWRVALCITLVLLLLERRCSAECNSGVLRMKPFPTLALSARGGLYDPCYLSASRQGVSVVGVKSFCGVEYKAAVNASGVVRLIPLSAATFNYNIPYPVPGYERNHTMPCKNLNSSGLLKVGSSTSATVTLWDQVSGGDISNLTKTGPNQITLYITNRYTVSQDTFSRPYPICRYNYTVVSGCFMGIKAPSAPPACPASYYVATGRAGAKYCAPCPPGTSSTGPNSRSCTPCRAGTYNGQYGGKCQQCASEGGYSTKAGSMECNSCEVDEWTDGKKCIKCPTGSYLSTTNFKQCHKCKAGVKCCTVNPSKDCPACPKGWTRSPPTASVFALSSGSSSACLTSDYALCAPKFKVTIKETCLMDIVPLPLVSPAVQDCKWSAQAAVKGKRVNLKADLFNYDDRSGTLGFYVALLSGNVTKVSPPYVDFTVEPVSFDMGNMIVAPKCTLRYRALTASAAQLGAAPKSCPKGKPGCASSAGTCPAGQYLETQTNVNPPSCLPCPPGTYKKVPSTTRCTLCPLGQFAAGYGNKACKSCPASAPLTPKKGAAACKRCDGGLQVGVNKCKACPRFSGKPSSGADVCLSNQFGSICCALGNCKGTPTCPSKLQAPGFDAGAVLQLVSRNLPQPQCKNATPLTCMDNNAIALLSYPSNNGISFQLDPIMQPRCGGMGTYDPDALYLISLTGVFTGAKRAAGTFNGTGYELQSNAATRTITVATSKIVDPTTTNTANPTQCTATFKLVTGKAFGLVPPARAKCPSNAIAAKQGGQSFCKFCPANTYKKASTGQCVSCPDGTYQDQLGGTRCNACPAGSSCEYEFKPNRCQPGFYSSKAGAVKCKECPANTYSSKRKATSCTSCPKFTVAPKGSAACYVPFPK